jgi:hypothetical protein
LRRCPDRIRSPLLDANDALQGVTEDVFIEKAAKGDL